jgi:hypothetical protein
MKKQMLNRAWALVGVVALLVPSFALAENPWIKAKERAEAVKERMETRQEERAEKRNDTFCERFTDQSKKISDRITERAGRIENRITSREDRYSERRENRDAKLSEKRSAQDERYSERYASLEATADTDAEKKAVVVFRKAMDAALDVRREVVDDALEAFRTGVDAAITGRKSSMENTLKTFESSVDAAIASAKSACESGTDPATVRENFRESLESAREKLKNDRSNMETVGQKVKALAETKKTALAKALADFKAAAEKARTELKTAFGEE